MSTPPTTRQESQRAEQHFDELIRVLERRKATVQAQLEQTVAEKLKLLQEDIEVHETHVNKRKHALNKLKVRLYVYAKASMCRRVGQFASFRALSEYETLRHVCLQGVLTHGGEEELLGVSGILSRRFKQLTAEMPQLVPRAEPVLHLNDLEDHTKDFHR